MTRSKIIQSIQKLHPELTLEQVEDSISLIFDMIANSLQKEERVELRGFGVFIVRQRKQRLGHNPRTGELVSIKQRLVPFFKAGKQLKDRLNPMDKAA